MQAYHEIQDIVQYRVEMFADHLGRPDLRSSLYVLVQEPALNALRATYFHVLQEERLSRGETPPDSGSWPDEFVRILETDGGKAFTELCIKSNRFVTIRAFPVERDFRIEILNEGEPDSSDHRRIRAAFEKANHLKEKPNEGEQYPDPDPENQVFFLSGIPLVLSTLEGLGLDHSHFSMRVRDEHTVARISLPLRIFRTGYQKTARLTDRQTDAGSNQQLLDRLNVATAIFTENGDIESLSEKMPDLLQVTPDQLEIDPEKNKITFKKSIFPGRFYSDLFYEENLIAPGSTFENYRIWLPSGTGTGEILFNISGYRTEDGKRIITLWQQVIVEATSGRLSEGSIMENLALQKLIHPYIPGNALARAREVIRAGMKRIPDEMQDLTIMFADLSGFTTMTEQSDLRDTVDTLNLAMSQAAMAIDNNNGKIEKFMGDAVMAVFRNPLHAVIAGMMIQFEFKLFNYLRDGKGKSPIMFRIGVHSGNVIIANIGTKDRMDWTPIGDVVNTASRLERASKPGQLLISEETYSRIEHHVTVYGKEHLKLKGKKQEMDAVYVQSVHYSQNGHEYRVDLEINEDPNLKPGYLSAE